MNHANEDGLGRFLISLLLMALPARALITGIQNSFNSYLFEFYLSALDPVLLPLNEVQSWDKLPVSRLPRTRMRIIGQAK